MEKTEIKTLSKSDPFYNVVMNVPELPEGLKYLKNKYKKLADLSKDKSLLKTDVFKEVEYGKCEYIDAKVFCDIYLR